MKKNIHMENRKAKRFNPEPDDAEKALFFKNEIIVKFACDDFDREAIDLSETGIKVYIEDNDPLEEYLNKEIKVLLKLAHKPISTKVKIVHKTENEYGLAYIGCKFVELKEEYKDQIEKYLKDQNSKKE